MRVQPNRLPDCHSEMNFLLIAGGLFQGGGEVSRVFSLVSAEHRCFRAGKIICCMEGRFPLIGTHLAPALHSIRITIAIYSGIN